MSWLSDWWFKLFSSPQKKEPKKPETYNVGEICILITYRDSLDHVVRSTGYLYGKIIPWIDDQVLVSTAREVLDRFMEDSVKYGIYRIGNKFIPRERVLELYTTYQDHWVEND